MWVPELPFQLACQREGGLRERPLAFLSPEGRTLVGRPPCLWFVNRLARAEGVAAGDPMDHALRRLPGLRVLDPAPQVWWEAQMGLKDFLAHWSPQGLLGRMGEALVELKGTERVHGPLRDAAWKLRRELANREGWDSHGGLSESAAAARLAARMEQQLEWVPGGDEASFLAPHPLKRLPDLNLKMALRLRRLGLHRVGDLQPVPLPTLARLLPEDEARRLLERARGEDRPRLPLLADPPGESTLPWRLEPPRLAEEVPLAAWCLERLWEETRSPRRLTLAWWDVDGATHHWVAPPETLCTPPLELSRTLECAFRQGCQRRILIHRLELRVAWGLGRPQGLFEEPLTRKLNALEPALARLRRRFPERPVRPGFSVG
nr:hypothetical protein [uncultured Holophaga sp.]